MISLAVDSEQGYHRRVDELMESANLTLNQAIKAADYEYAQRNWGVYNYYDSTHEEKRNEP